MGTVVVGLILLVIICLIVHSMIKAKKNGKSIDVVEIVHIVEVIATDKEDADV